MGKAPTTSKFVLGRNPPPRETLIKDIQERSILKASSVKDGLVNKVTSKAKVGVHNINVGVKPPYEGTLALVERSRSQTHRD